MAKMGYQEASSIRGEGALHQVSKNLVQGKGIGTSFKEGISSYAKAKAVGIKEKFDPLNLIKKITGGSSLGPALLGRLLGRSDKDVEYFTGIKKERIKGITPNENLKDLLDKLYLLFVKTEIQDIKIRDINRNFVKQEEKTAEKHHKEIVGVLTTLGQKKQEIPQKVVEETGTPSPTTTPKSPPAAAAPRPSAGPAAAPRPSPVKSPPTSGFPTNLPSAAPATSTASRVVTGTIVAGGTLIGSSIGASESGGNYDITYGDRTQKGKLINVSGQKTPEEFLGKKLTDFTLAEVQQFQRYRESTKMGTSAVGKYQFMPNTLFGRTSRGKFYPGLVQQLGLSMNEKFSGPIQEKLYELLHSKDVAALKAAGVPVTPGNEYMAHYIGAAGTAAVHRALKTNPNMTVAEVMKNSGYPVGNNKELYEIKIKDFESILEKRLKKGMGSPHAAAQQPVLKTGEVIGDITKENANVLKDVKGQTPIIINNNNTTFIKPGDRNTTVIKKKDYNEPALMQQQRGQ